MIAIIRIWRSLDIALDFLVRRSEKKGLKRTLILSDILKQDRVLPRFIGV